MTGDGIFVQITSQDQLYCIIIEDDGDVGYAYLLNAERKIVSDVWLYNRAPTPEGHDWETDPDNAPFLNSERFLRVGDFLLPHDADDFSVQWNGVEALVFVRNQLIAMLADGAKPGWSSRVSHDGPLARVLRTQ
jgi:hypothetical protein